MTPVALVESRYLRHVKIVWQFMRSVYYQIIPLVECVYSHYSKPAILACVVDLMRVAVAAGKLVKRFCCADRTRQCCATGSGTCVFA